VTVSLPNPADNQTGSQTGSQTPRTPEAGATPPQPRLRPVAWRDQSRPFDPAAAEHGLAGLLTANAALAAAATMPELLSRIVQSARDLVDAGNATLELPGPAGDPAQPPDAEQPLPAGIDEQPTAGGPLPPEKRVSSSLRIPIGIGIRTFGHLQLTGKRDGRPFTDQDQELLTGLAATAAVAIDHARRHEESDRRQRWQQATTRITTALLSQADSPELLRLVMAEGRLLVDADDVLITRSAHGEKETLHALAGVRDTAGQWDRVTLPLPGTVTAMVLGSGALVSADLSVDERFPQAETLHPGVGPLIARPLAAAGVTFAVLIVTRRCGHPPFTAHEQDTIEHFSEQIALALELARARTDSQRMLLVAERDRIARDMHDHVIGRLVGSGMAIQGLSKWITDQAGHRRLAAHLDDLDAAVQDLRTLIYGLDRDPAQVWSLPARIQQVLDEASSHLGFTPTQEVDPEVDRSVGPLSDSATAEHLLAVLREALTNVARHAAASAVHVTVTGGHSLDLTVTDDGCGFPAHRPAPTASGGHGLANIADRAAGLDGTVTLSGNPAGGATLHWSAPILR
jgi:signal transduction histidine kinase